MQLLPAKSLPGDCPGILPGIMLAGMLAALLWTTNVRAAQAVKPQRPRHRAAGISLFCYETMSGGVDLLKHERGLADTINTLRRFGQLLVHESGFVLPEVVRSLQPPGLAQPTPKTIIQQLAKTKRPPPALQPPYKGQSMSRPQAPGPSIILLASTLALTYGMQTNDGLRAMSQCAGLYTRDPRAIACARACYLMVAVSVSGQTDKDVIVRIAAGAAEQPAVASLLLGMRVKSWRELAPDTTFVGSFIRAAKVWYSRKTYSQTMSSARRILRQPDARRFVAVMCGAYYSLPNLPEDLVARAIAMPKTNVLLADLFRLCNEGFLVRVPMRKTGHLQSNSLPGKTLPQSSSQNIRALGPGQALALTHKSTIPANPGNRSKPKPLKNKVALRARAKITSHFSPVLDDASGVAPPGSTTESTSLSSRLAGDADDSPKKCELILARTLSSSPLNIISKPSTSTNRQLPPKAPLPASKVMSKIPRKDKAKIPSLPQMPPVPKFPNPPTIPGIPDLPND